MNYYAYAAFFLLFPLLLEPLTITTTIAAAQNNDKSIIELGSSLSPIGHNTSWDSPSGRFRFGFYQEDGGFRVGIRLIGKPDNIITWTANRDDHPLSSLATIKLTREGLLLKTDARMERPIAKLPSPAAYAAMLNNGGLELYDQDSKVIWATYYQPTDTLLGDQSLSVNTELRSSVSETNHSAGHYRLVMQEDGNVVSYPINTEGSSFAYWASSTFLSNSSLYLNTSGYFLLIDQTNSSNSMLLDSKLDSVPYDDSIIYRATLGSNGIFRLYSHMFNTTGWYNTLKRWSVPGQVCDVKSFCGFNSYCTLIDDLPDCKCVPGTVFIDPTEPTLGCKRNFVEQKCEGHNEDAKNSYNMTAQDNMRWLDRPYFVAEMSEDKCIDSCRQDCKCEVAQFQEPNCMMQTLPVRYVKRDQSDEGVHSKAFFKTGATIIERNNQTIQSAIIITRSNVSLQLIIVVTMVFITCSCVALAVSGFFIFKFRLVKYRRLLELGDLGFNQELSLRPFSYSELKRATNGFKEELGRGGFGAVYKGTLHRGKKLIAVKRLERMAKEGEKEFHAEIHVIAKIHHKNLVRLIGYCAQDSKRLLVYEYMSNDSLADALFRTESRPLDWSERVRIALEVARGILYLHEECEAPVIHCDIKPQNILLDEFWTAKISDFGLAKLLMPDQTRTFTVLRGTRGYVAPEWHKNIPISVKADVYSYGIVLLEIVCCRKNLELRASKPEEVVLPSWAYKCLISNELNRLVGGQEVDKKTFERFLMVALWCIQDEPALRPSMKSVVMMLEGVTNIAVPPCPTFATA